MNIDDDNTLAEEVGTIIIAYNNSSISDPKRFYTKLVGLYMSGDVSEEALQIVGNVLGISRTPEAKPRKPTSKPSRTSYSSGSTCSPGSPSSSC